MAPFDPYHIWLGIPETERPISKYRLLGIADFEDNREVISVAAEQRTIYLRTLQAGEHSILVAELLNEVSQARVTLLNEDQKAAYDEELRKQQTPEPEPEPTPPPIPVVQTPTASPVVVRGTVTQDFPVSVVQQAKRPRRRKQKQIWKQPAVIGVFLVGVIAVLVLVISMMSFEDTGPVVSNTPPVVSSPLMPSPQTDPVPQPKTPPTVPPQQTQLPASNETLPAKVAVAPPLAVAPFDVAQAKAHQQAWSKYLEVPVEYTNSIGMKLVLIPPGEFMMGSPDYEDGRNINYGEDAETQHQVTLTKPFFVGVTEVTQFQFAKVLRKNPSKFKAEKHPVEQVTWKDAFEFCARLSDLPEEKRAGRVYRLPFEAEWEYACRAGTNTPFSFGKDHSQLSRYASWQLDSGSTTHAVKLKKSNPWGLYDMHGNVWEWCYNAFRDYPSGAVTDPMGTSNGDPLSRGGGYNGLSHYLRSARRHSVPEGHSSSEIGFRVVYTIAKNVAPATKSPPPSLSEGLVAYYPFNGNAQDESGNGNDGVVQGAALTADRHGLPGSAYGFDGTKDMINLGDQWGDFGTDPFTIALWVYRKTTSNCDAFVSKGKYGNAQWNLVTANPTDNGMTPRNHIRFGLRSRVSNGNNIHSTSQVGTKTWHHVVIQRNTRGLNMFIDGFLDASLTCSPLNADSSFPVGCGFTDTWQPNEYRMNGFLDDIRIYNRALSAAEVKSLYEYESKPSASPIPTAPAIESTTNTFGMTFDKIPAGTFMMGSPEGEEGRRNDEHQHKVTITKPFYMQTTEVTQGQWTEVMETEPWKGKQYVKEGPNYAATYVSWDDAVAFCKQLSAREGQTYRLPTEAEWEYACRAGTETAWSFGDDEKSLGDYAWYRENADSAGAAYAHQIGLKKPNAFGLYDMHGNVYEWCHDYYGEDYYQQSPQLNPPGPAVGSSRVLRNGSWGSQLRHTRSGRRLWEDADDRGGANGFRLVRESDDSTHNVTPIPPDPEPQSETESNRLRTFSTNSAVYCVAFSPDGKQIVSGSGHKMIKIWDAETGKEINTLAGHTSTVLSVAFSPDGKVIASGSHDNTIKLWNNQTGAWLKTLAGHSSAVKSVAFSPDGGWIASGSSDHTIKVWDTATGAEIMTLTGHSNDVWSVAISPDGKTIVSGGSGNINVVSGRQHENIIIWDAESGEVIKTLEGHSASVNSVAFSPDGKTIASGSYRNIKLWNSQTGVVLKTLAGLAGNIVGGFTSVAFSPDGKTLASAGVSVDGNNGTITIWDRNTGEELRTLAGHARSVHSVAFSPDGKTIASGGMDKTVKLWNIGSELAPRTIAGTSRGFNSVVFSPDGKTIASGGADETIRIWNAETGEEIKTLAGNIMGGYQAIVTSVAFSPDGKTIASGNDRGRIKLWNSQTGAEIKAFGPDIDVSSVLKVIFSTDGKRLASVNTRAVRSWDIRFGRLIGIRELSLMRCFAFSPDGKTTASGSHSSPTIKVRDTATGEEIITLEGHGSVVLSVTFSPDGKTLASGSGDNTVKLWNSQTGVVLKTLAGLAGNIVGGVTSVAFSPDGKTLASGSGDNTVKLWDVQTGKEIDTLAAHSKRIKCIAFSPDGKTLASGSDDGTIKLWYIE
jgi:WD40 repeat protein